MPKKWLLSVFIVATVVSLMSSFRDSDRVELKHNILVKDAQLYKAAMRKTPAKSRTRERDIASHSEVESLRIHLNGKSLYNESIGSTEVDELILDPDAEMSIRGHVVFRAKKINIRGMIKGDFPVFMENNAPRFEESILEMHATQELVVTGTVFLRHFWKLGPAETIVANHNIVLSEEKERLRLSAPKIYLPGFLSLSFDDLEPLRADVWVSVSHPEQSLVDADSFNNSRRVHFFPEK